MRPVRALAAIAAAAIVWAGAARAAPPLEAYGALPAMEQPRLSPSGDALAYIAQLDAGRRVVIRTAGGPVLFSVGLGDLKLRAVEWLGEGHLLVTTSQTRAAAGGQPGGQAFEASQSTIIDAANGKLTRVFAGRPDLYPATFNAYGYARIGGREYGYFAGRPAVGDGAVITFQTTTPWNFPGHDNLYRVDLASGQVQWVAAGANGRKTTWVVGARGQVTAHDTYSDKTGRWSLFAGADDAAPIARADDPAGEIDLVGQGRSDDEVLVERPGGAGGADQSYRLYRVDGHGAVAAPFGDANIRALISDPATGFLIGAVTDEDAPLTILIDPVLQDRFDKVRRALPGETVTLASATGDLRRMVVFAEGPGDPGTWFFADLAAGTVQAFGWRYPLVPPGDVAPTRLFAWRAADGRSLQGVLTLPQGRTPKDLPVVVLPHGGPQARDYLGFDWWAQAFASRGYAVLQPNFRGSSGFGQAFREAGYGQWGRKMQSDISDGLAALAASGVVDPARACIVGGSYGGYAALAGVTVQHGLYRCAVSVAGVSDLAGMLAWDAARWGKASAVARYERFYLGLAASDPQALAALSPVALAARADAPILLIWGDKDTIVPARQSVAMGEALRKAGKSVETLELPGEDHWLSRQASRVAMLKASAAFVEKYDPP
ncbi:MAG TPA: prolyl oligopeptidase family serine peptidase [Caulobacteraceae bacterium]